MMINLEQVLQGGGEFIEDGDGGSLRSRLVVRLIGVVRARCH